jgi:hypothetical protein
MPHTCESKRRSRNHSKLRSRNHRCSSLMTLIQSGEAAIANVALRATLSDETARRRGAEPPNLRNLCKFHKFVPTYL